MRQILIAGSIALFFALFGTPVLIRFLARRGYGQIIRDDGPSSHHTKRGTPTMGGIIIIFSAAAAYFIAHLITGNAISTSALLVLGLMASLGFVGFLDDWLKVSRQKSLGLNAKQKIIGQVIFAAAFGYLGIHFPDGDGLTPISQNLSTVRDTSIVLGTVFVVIWVVLMVTATSNGVNLTDGLDGLAAGTSAVSVLALGIFTFVSGNIIFSNYLNIMYIPNSGEMTVFIAAFVGALIGFLWYNSYPASVFMGDTGSLTIGGVIAVLAIAVRKELLIPLLCGIFLAENFSVVLQVAYFKYTKKRTGEGKRIFLMAPLHHHYQKKGYHESKIVTRFWIVAIMLAILSIVTLKLR